QKFIGAADFINYNRQGIAWYRQAINDPNAFGAFLDGANGMGTGGDAINSPFTTQLLTPSNQYLSNQPGWNSIPDIINPGQNILCFDDNTVGDLIYQSSAWI